MSGARCAHFEGPLFIVGMPRSGTKLLRDILNRHPRVALPRIETEFLPYWVENWASYGNLADRKRFQRFYERCRALPFFVYAEDAGQGIDADGWHRRCPDFTPAGVFRGLIKTHLDLDGGEGLIWGDKSPSYVTHIPLLDRLFPAARFIHIVRDVRDYCLSINRAWGKNMRRAAQRWAEDVAAGRAAGAALGGDYLELRYEDLLEDPPGTVSRACAFLDIAYDDRLLALSAATENIGDARGVAGILKGNTRKYESALAFRERKAIEALAAPTLVAAGYDCDYAGPAKRLGPLRWRFLQLLDGVNLVAFSARERGFVGALRFVLRYFAVSGNRRRRS